MLLITTNKQVSTVLKDKTLQEAIAIFDEIHGSGNKFPSTLSLSGYIYVTFDGWHALIEASEGN